MVLRVDERYNWPSACFLRAFLGGTHHSSPFPNRRMCSHTAKPSLTLRIVVSLFRCACRLFFYQLEMLRDLLDSYSDEASMWYEVLRYRMLGNGAPSAARHIVIFPPPLNSFSPVRRFTTPMYHCRPELGPWAICIQRQWVHHLLSRRRWLPATPDTMLRNFRLYRGLP